MSKIFQNGKMAWKVPKCSYQKTLKVFLFVSLDDWMILMNKIQNMLAHTEENVFILVIRFPHFLCVPSRTETFQAIQ